jgi:3-hydroxyacyl-[acyl-carrier-protein] dehydratase
LRPGLRYGRVATRRGFPGPLPDARAGFAPHPFRNASFRQPPFRKPQPVRAGSPDPMRLEYFQMIDRFTSVDAPGRAISTICKVPDASPVFEGHFPGYPLMPGVLLIECMAQTCGWLTSAITGFTGLPVLAGVKEGKIRTAVFPGDTLEFDGRIIHDGSGYTMAQCKGRANGKKACDAELTFRVIPYPSPEFRKTMWDWAERLDFPLKEFVRE